MTTCKSPVTDGNGIDDEGKMMPTQGAIIPDGYTQHGSESHSWACPIRSCRRLFRNIGALGSHFNVSIYSPSPMLTREL